MAIVEGKCDIVIPSAQVIQLLRGMEPPIPSDEELEEHFPEWKSRARLFVARCAEQEGKGSMDEINQVDMMKYGMKFIICEAKKIMTDAD